MTVEAPVAGTFTLYTIDGKQVASCELAAATTSVSLPRDLAAGIYMCRFNGTDGSTAVVRLVYEPK